VKTGISDSAFLVISPKNTFILPALFHFPMPAQLRTYRGLLLWVILTGESKG
jgi:hypothetical protein